MVGALTVGDSAWAGECWPLRQLQPQVHGMGWTRWPVVETECLREACHLEQIPHARQKLHAHPDAGEAHVVGMEVMDRGRRRSELPALLVVLHSRYIEEGIRKEVKFHAGGSDTEVSTKTFALNFPAGLRACIARQTIIYKGCIGIAQTIGVNTHMCTQKMVTK